MTRSSLKFVAVLALGLLVTWGLAGSAAAYCIKQIDADRWGDLPDDSYEIPVYVSIGEHTNVTNTGLTVAEVERLTREMIARHNEASIGPILVYTGLTVEDMHYEKDEGDQEWTQDSPFKTRLEGITVDSYSCEYWESYHPCGNKKTTRACASSGAAAPKARVSLVPVGCADNKPQHTLDGNDLATVLLHEFGHVLGLQHNQGTKASCEKKAEHEHGNDEISNDGVMRASLGANIPATREWRRDDLDGLAKLYGSPPTMEVVYWEDGIFPAAPTIPELTFEDNVSFYRPPAVTSATSSGGADQYIATTAADGRVLVYTHGFAGLSEPEIIDPSASGRSWGNPGVALGQNELLVVWAADEQAHDSRIKLRWAVRSLADQTWTITEAQELSRVKRLGAGYAPGVDLFVVTALAEYSSLPVLHIIDADGERLGTHELLGPVAFDIGAPACFAEGPVSRCVIPYSTSSFAGPNLGWLDIELDGDGEAWVLDDTAGYINATGKLGLASRPDAAVFRGTAGSQRYDLDRLPGVGAVDLPNQIPLPMSETQGWPVVVGSSGGRGLTRWWGFSRHRVECGDGIEQGVEECDDGNVEPDDGCSAECLLEQPDDDPVAGTETGGAYGSDVGEDCDCRTGRGSPIGFGLVVVVLCATRRRRLAA